MGTSTQSERSRKAFHVVWSNQGEKELAIGSLSELRVFLQNQISLAPQVYIFTAWDGCELTVGLGGPIGFVQHSESGLPPYRLALGDDRNEGRWAEFDSGGTPTPIPMKFCLLAHQVEEIVMHYYLNGQLPGDFNWVEI